MPDELLVLQVIEGVVLVARSLSAANLALVNALRVPRRDWEGVGLSGHEAELNVNARGLTSQLSLRQASRRVGGEAGRAAGRSSTGCVVRLLLLIGAVRPRMEGKRPIPNRTRRWVGDTCLSTSAMLPDFGVPRPATLTPARLIPRTWTVV